ncbi:MAG TPA: hypothetical protein VFC46_13035 [Humisphaera sp.]|nr:hypothetical protein [Humisphaera sp.]
MGREFGIFRLLLALSFLHLAPGAASASDDTIQKVAVPDAAAARSARSRVNEIFGGEIAKAKKPGEKTAVAKKLLQLAETTANDAAAKYVALTMARELAAADGDAQTAFAAIEGLETYAVDSLKLKADTLASIMKSTGSPQDSLAGPLVEQAIDVDRFAIGRQLAETCLSAAKLAGDAGAIANAAAWLAEVRDIESASGAATKAAAILATRPEDPNASLTLGRFDAFLKNYWDKAIPLLASSSDTILKNLAQMELSAATDPNKQLQAANGWWEFSGKERGIAQSHIREHAAHLYKKALPGLVGLEKVLAEKRVEQGGVVRTSYTGWNNLLRKVNIDRDAIKGKWSLEGGALSMGTRAELKIAPEPQKDYALRVEFARQDSNNVGATFTLLLPVADTQVNLSIDPDRLGLDIVDGKRWMSGDTIKKGDFGGVRKKHVVEVSVWQEAPEARILVSIDGRQQLEWTGLPSRLSAPGDLAMKPPVICLGSWDATVTITGIALKEATP